VRNIHSQDMRERSQTTLPRFHYEIDATAMCRVYDAMCLQKLTE